MGTRHRAITIGLLACAALGGSRSGADAQERESAMCRAEAMTPALPAGLKATPVTFELTRPVGEITTLQVWDAEAGLELAEPGDLPRAAMVSEAEAPSPISMSNENRRVTLWVSTEGVEPGMYEIRLRGAQGDCTAQLEVARGG